MTTIAEIIATKSAALKNDGHPRTSRYHLNLDLSGTGLGVLARDEADEPFPDILKSV